MSSYSEIAQQHVQGYIPEDFKKNSRACMCCGLILHRHQFEENGCPNCDFLDIAGKSANLNKFTTRHYSGVVGLLDPNAWSARWNRINGIMGIYAIQMKGSIPDDFEELCHSNGRCCRIVECGDMNAER